MAKSLERLQAREMRRKGESIREIAKKLNVSRSSASLWCRDIILSEKQVCNLLQRDIVGGIKGRIKAWEWHREEKSRRYKLNYDLGYKDVDILSNKELFYIGLALYWSEGSKRSGRVLLTNSDPQMIELYIRWIKECFGVKPGEITCRVTINESHNDRREEIERFWVDVVGLPISQFTKTTIIHSKWAKLYENRKTYYGVLAVLVQKSTNLNYRVMGSIDRLREMGKVRGKIKELAE